MRAAASRRRLAVQHDIVDRLGTAQQDVAVARRFDRHRMVTHAAGEESGLAGLTHAHPGVLLFLVPKLTVGNPHGYVGYVGFSLANQGFAACHFGLEPIVPRTAGKGPGTQKGRRDQVSGGPIERFTGQASTAAYQSK
jgi:hypothetical protein